VPGPRDGQVVDDDEPSAGVAVDRRSARLRIDPEQDIHREIVFDGFMIRKRARWAFCTSTA
jgi:hypothetical protein